MKKFCSAVILGCYTMYLNILIGYEQIIPNSIPLCNINMIDHIHKLGYNHID